jgi:hypothetical protein
LADGFVVDAAVVDGVSESVTAPVARSVGE